MAEAEIDMKDPPEGVLLLVFAKSDSPTLFNTRVYHTEVELILINSPMPPIPFPGFEGKNIMFDHKSALMVYIGRLEGVAHCTHMAERFRSINNTRNSVLCIPLTSTEFPRVIDFMYTVRGIRFNHWDYMVSHTAALIPTGTVEDIVIDPKKNVRESIQCLHPPQLAALIVRHCIDPSCVVNAKLWGFNSRLITANELFEQLRLTCMAIDADGISMSRLQAISRGIGKR